MLTGRRAVWEAALKAEALRIGVVCAVLPTRDAAEIELQLKVWETGPDVKATFNFVEADKNGRNIGKLCAAMIAEAVDRVAVRVDKSGAR